ncbi:MAG: cytosine permease [Alicyclobacillus sp.]|nr:cytosine permease [Alicyclobacillus sp.]
MNVERRSIDFIPDAERHGSVRNLFAIWFAANMQMTTLVTGGLAVEFGLNLFWSVVAILVGSLIGTFFMASHSAQGPKLGIPQMIQSRAQFGVMGACLPIVIVILMYIGFYAGGAVLGAQALSGITSMSVTWSLIILGLATFIVAVFGYDLIHSMQRYLTIFFFIIFVAVTVKVFTLPLPAGSWSPANFRPAEFLLAVSVVATYQLTYAPYVADYSRYLPRNTSIAKTFHYTYWGSVIGVVWMMLLGVMLTASISHYLENASQNLGGLFGSLSYVIYIAIVLGILGVNVLNLYGGFMSITTTAEVFAPIRVTPKVRFGLVLLVAVLSTALAIWGQGNFLENFTNFLLLLMYFMVPWTAINLTDFYLIRRGNYVVEDIFNPNGQYGRFNWIALAAYLIAVGCQFPFINTTIYEGPIAKWLGGADIAWIVGLIVPTLLYYFPMKKKFGSSFATPSWYADSV